ncbi:MAG: glycosyltransferase, partial [Hyphomicrobiaceae bacterium]
MPIFARKKTLNIGLSPLVEGGRVRRDDLQIALQQRRWVFLALNVATIAALTLAMAQILSIGGWSIAKVAMLVAYITTLPWLSIGFWNAIIGFLSLARQNRSAAETTADDPLALHFDRTAPLTTRTAVVMALRNEEAASAIARLRTMYDDLLRQGCAAHFDFHVLSDTNDPAIAKEEEQLVSDWRGESSISEQIFYRRRHDNAGYKAGNIDEFCRRTVKDYDFFLPLDADSLMSAAAIQRLVRILEANPRVGILQTLVVGAPAKTFFARAFQFGMRHGMRAYTSGSVWWQGDCGPY